MKTKNVLTVFALSVILLVSNASAGEYFFHLHDHLGNTRVVVDVNKNVVERYDYYPFGLVSRSSVSSEIETVQKFTGKELDDEHGVELYYFGARYHDPVTGRFVSVDPMAGKYPGLSPYSYCANNPLILVDPDGRIIDTIFDIASIAYDIYDISHTYASGGKPSTMQWAALGADVGGLAVPFATGAGAAVRAAAKADELVKVAKVVDTAVDVEKAADNVNDARKAMERGLESEKRVLSELGLNKNTTKVTGVEGNSIPDAITDTQIIEIKDTQRVSNTKQIRIQRDAAKKANKKHVVITGKNTQVSTNLRKQSKIIDKKDLGPQ